MNPVLSRPSGQAASRETSRCLNNSINPSWASVRKGEQLAFEPPKKAKIKIEK